MNKVEEYCRKNLQMFNTMKENVFNKHIITDSNLHYMVTDNASITFKNTPYLAYFDIDNVKVFDNQEQAQMFLNSIPNKYKRGDGQIININIMPLSKTLEKLIAETEITIDLIKDL